MKAISISERRGFYIVEGWQVVFNTFSSKESGVNHYENIRKWLNENILDDGQWSLVNTTTIVFRDHVDAMLCFMHFSAGIQE